ARLFFNADVSKDAQELGDAVTVISRTMLQEFYELLPVPDWIPLPSKIAKRNAIAKIDRLIYDSMAARKKQQEQSNDVLSMLMRARDTDGDGEGMSELQIRDEAITLFNAGHDSTAAGLSWAWYLLLKNPDVYDRLISDTAPTSEPPSIAAQVSKEALRLYPPAWTLPRKSTGD